MSVDTIRSMTPNPGADRPTGNTWDQAATAFAAWRLGDDHAINDLVIAMTPVLWHVVRSYHLAESDARDAIQNTWVALVRHRASITDEQAVAKWLTTTARREAARLADRSKTPAPVSTEVLDTVLPEEESAEDQAETELRDDALWTALRTLSERCQHLLRIVAFEARPDYAATSSYLGIAVGSIGPTRRRCLDKLRAELIASGGVA